MATQTRIQSQPHHVSFLRRALQVDGIFSTASGLLFAGLSAAVGEFLGMDSAIVLELGLVLLVYGVVLFWLATSRPIDRRLPITIIALNIAWVVMSALVLIADPFGMTVEGKWGVLIVADVVGVFAIWQFIGLRRLQRQGE